MGQYVGEKVGKQIGEKVGDKLGDKLNDMLSSSNDKDDEEEEENKKKKKKGGSCSGGANQGDQSSDSPGKCDGTSPQELGEVGLEDVDESTNSMCKKIYTIYRPIPKDVSCP